MSTTTVYQNNAPAYTSTNGVISPITSSGGSSSASYSPAQVASINAAREANVDAGVSAYSGNGATPGSIAGGQTPTGTGTPLYAVPSTINSSNTKPNTGVVIPPAPAVSNTGTNAMTQIAGTAAAATATNPATAPTTTTTDADTAFQTYLKSIQAPPSTADEYTADRASSGIDADQQAVNTYQSQLNAITAKAQADKLSLVGQGNGVPNPIIGGQQAEIDREAAIQALPISAQLAAAQSNLTLAQDNLDTLFKLRSEDAQNQVTYQNSLVTAVYNYADDKQKTELAAVQDQNNKAFTLMTNNLNYAQSLATTAIQNGQPGLAAQLMKLDPNDTNYAANIATLAGGIAVQKAPTAAEAQAQIGADLADSKTYLTTNPGNAADARQAFIAAHPGSASDWDSYWGVTTANPDGNYPAASSASGPGVISSVVNWFKSL